MFSIKSITTGFTTRHHNDDGWQFFHRILTAIESSVDLSEGLGAALELARQELECPRLAVVLKSHSGWAQPDVYHAQANGHRATSKLSLNGDICELFEGLMAPREIVTDAERQKLLQTLSNGNASGRGEENSGNFRILIAPFLRQSVPVGALIATFPASTGMSQSQWAVFDMVASVMAPAVQQKQLEQRERARSRRDRITADLTATLGNWEGPDEILQTAVETIGRALEVSRAAIYINRNDEPGRGGPLVARAEFRGREGLPSVLGRQLSFGGSPALERVFAGEKLLIADIKEADPLMRASAIQNGVKSIAYLPLKQLGTTRAVLCLERHDAPGCITQEESELVDVIIGEIAAALHRHEMHREADEKSRRETLIFKVASAMHSSLDQDTILSGIVRELGEAFGACYCSLVLLHDPMPEVLEPAYGYVASCCDEKPFEEFQIPTAGNQHLQLVVASRTPIAVEDIDGDPAFSLYREYFNRTGARSLLATAIRVAGRPIGMISLIRSHAVGHWTEWEIDLLQLVAGQAAIAMRQVELYKDARESATRAALLNEIFSSIRRSLDLDEILQVAVRELGHSLNASRVVFRKLCDDELVVAAEYLENSYESLSEVRDSVSAYNLRSIAEAGRTLVINDVKQFAAAYPEIASGVESWSMDSSVEGATRSEIIRPIFVNYEFWGALSIHQTDRPRRWSAGEIAMVEAVTAQIEIAVGHSRLFEEATGAARREALIGRIINGVNQSNDVDQILPLVARELADFLGCDSLSIVDHSPETNAWTSIWRYSRGEITRPGIKFSAGHFPGLLAELEDAPVICNDMAGDERVSPVIEELLRPSGVCSFAAVPVRHQESLKLAILAAMSQPHKWSEQEIDVLTSASNQIVSALQRAALFEQISRGKREWEATFDALTDGIFIFDRDGILTRVNEAGAALEGKSVADLVGRRCCTLLESVETEGCQVSTVIQTCRSVTFELTPRRLTQSLLVTIFPLVDQPVPHPGSASGAVCVVRDLSQLRAVEAVAREQRNFLAKLIEHANDAIFALSPEGRFIWFNDQLAQLSAYSRDELFASDFRRFLTEPDKKLAIERFARALSGEAQTFEMHGVRKNGESRLLLMTYTPIYDKGRISSVLCIARDITEERLAAERAAQADKLRALGQLASGVAHNFNNILAAILGHAQLIKRDNPDERLVKRVEIIEKAALDGAQTVKRIQGFALQQDEAVLETIDINQLVQDSANLTRARWADEAQASGLPYEVELRLAPATPLAMGSGSELREVFVNVILNALDAMPQGGRLLIQTESKDAAIQVGFSDSGVGMSKPVRDRIFEPFFTTKGTRGMGLGLAVSYSIVERHGGRIEVDSSPGRGSTFTIILPVVRSAIEAGNEIGLVETKTVDVLVIDDDERVREAIVDMLISAGHRAAQAGSGREGLNMMEDRQFNIVFTDLSMPEMDGWAVASEIRHRWPNVKVILATGYAIPAETIRSHTDLVNAVVFKPIKFDDITATVNRVLT